MIRSSFPVSVFLARTSSRLCFYESSGLSAGTRNSSLLLAGCRRLGPFCRAAVGPRGPQAALCSNHSSAIWMKLSGEEEEEEKSTWKYHDMMNISSHSAGMFWCFSIQGCYFSIFSNCHLPTGHRGLELETEEARSWQYTLKCTTEARRAVINRENVFKQTSPAPTSLFALSICLKRTSFYRKIKEREKKSPFFPPTDAVSLAVKSRGVGCNFFFFFFSNQ